MSTTTPAPFVPVAVTSQWRSWLLTLAEDATWGLSRDAIARRPTTIAAEIENVELTAIREARR